MIRVRVQDKRGVCRDLPDRFEVQGHAAPDIARRGEGSRQRHESQHGAPVEAHHLAIAQSIARRTGRQLARVQRSNRGVALHVDVGVPRYIKDGTIWDREIGYQHHRETTTRPRGRGWRREGFEIVGSCDAIIEAAP